MAAVLIKGSRFYIIPMFARDLDIFCFTKPEADGIITKLP